MTEQASGKPVSAALVQLLPTGRDSILLSLVTDARGRFRIARLSPGRYRIRTLRIGFRPWISEPLAIEAGHQEDLVFAVPAVPVVLNEITVEARSPCLGSPLENQQMALLWDEVRTTLSLLGAAGEEPLEFRSVITRRQLDPRDRLETEQSLPAFGRGAWPVASQPAESLFRFGFVQPRELATGPVYFGPDVAVFFSDPFLQTHCFLLIPSGAAEAALVGLGFEPVKGRPVVDIDGVLWLDRERNLLRRLEYRYTGLWPWVPRGSSGGTIDFGSLPDGRPIVTRWTIRAPVAQIRPWPVSVPARDESTRPYFGPGQVTLHGFREEIGTVQEIRRMDGPVLWRPDTAADGGPLPAVPSEDVDRP